MQGINVTIAEIQENGNQNYWSVNLAGTDRRKVVEAALQYIAKEERDDLRKRLGSIVEGAQSLIHRIEQDENDEDYCYSRDCLFSSFDDDDLHTVSGMEVIVYISLIEIL